MANQSAMRIGMAILASVITIADVALFTYIITEYLLDNINNIASGATTSAEGNDEIRDKTDKEKKERVMTLIEMMSLPISGLSRR